MEEKKLNIISKLKLRNNISNVLKPFFNKIMIFPNMLKKATTVSENMNNKKIFKVPISDNPLELLQKEIKAENLDKIIPEKNDLTQIVSPEKEIDKSKIFFIEDIKVSPEISEAIFNHEMYGKGDLLMLEPQELAKIPNVIDGHEISKFEKLQLATGSLDFPTYGTTYQIENNSIVKTQLNENLSPEKTVLLKTDISWNNPRDIERYNDLGQRNVVSNQREFGLKPLSSNEQKELTDLHNKLNNISPEVKENIIAKITITQSGEELLYSNKEDFLKSFAKELDTDIYGFKHETYDKSPEFLKAIDDLVYQEYGEKNPKKLEDYLKNDELNKMSGGKIKDIASEVIQKPRKFLELDSDLKNIIKDYLKSNGEEKLFEMNFNKYMADSWGLELSNKTELSQGMTNSQIDEKQASFYRKYESAANQLNIPINPLMDNISSKITMNEIQQKNFDYLEKNIKNLGFSNDENFKDLLAKKITGNEMNFSIKQSTDKNFFKSNKISFDLNFHRSNETGKVFLNSYNVNLENKNRTLPQSQNINLRQIPFSAKEAINLIEGRSVRTDINYKNGKKENVFLKLDFNSQKEDGNYNLKKFNPKYGINTDEILKNTNVFIAQDREDIHKRIIKSLEKGNVVPLLIKNDDGKIDKFNAVLNPQYKTINLYNSKMERVKEKESLEVGAKQEVIQSENVSQTNTSRKI